MPPRKPDQPHSRKDKKEYDRLYQQKRRAGWTDERRQKHRDAVRRYWTTKGYYARMGITKEEYDALFEAQGGKCAGCLTVPKDRLCIDHDHADGRVRALLCRSCNSALGLVKDNADTLRRLIALILYREETVPEADVRIGDQLYTMELGEGHRLVWPPDGGPQVGVSNAPFKHKPCQRCEAEGSKTAGEDPALD